MMTTPPRPFPTPNSISAMPAASASLRTVTGAPHRLREQRGRVRTDPPLVDVGRGAGDAVLDHRRERRAGGAGPVEVPEQLAHDPGDRVGRRRVRGQDALTRREQLPGLDVDRRPLDAGAADVDAEQSGHGHIVVSRCCALHVALSVLGTLKLL